MDSQKENERRQDNISQKSSTTSKTKDGNNKKSFELPTNTSSHLDNRSTKSFAGVWKPDAAVLHRLQGN